ncbi:MAG: rhodanese-like domain-containing protein [Lachnospira sp.]
MQDFELIGPRKVNYYVNNPYAVIIDLRKREDYYVNHVNGAVNVPFDDMMHFLHGRSEEPELYRLFYNKKLIYVFYCEHGSSSITVADKMSKKGYTAKSVAGGYEKIQNNFNF